MSNKYVWMIVGLVVFTMVLIVYHNRPKAKTDEVISSMENAIEQSQERADKIILETKRKEVSARAESRKSAYSLSDDELVNAINEMLCEYRRSQKN